MNRRSRLFRSGLMSGAGALVAGVAFFAVPAQEGYANTNCSDCYVVTPATAPATAGAGTGEDYAFQVTNNDPHETLRSLTFTAPADFVITGASGPSGTSVSAVPGSSVTLNLPGEPTGSTFTVDVTALAPCVAASSEVWGVSGIDSLGETNEVQLEFLAAQRVGHREVQPRLHRAACPDGGELRHPHRVQLDRFPARRAVGSTRTRTRSSQADFSASRTQVTVSIETNPGGGTLAGTTTVTSSNGVADFGNLQIDKAGVGYDLAASASGFASATSNLFTITGQIQACGSGSCSASQSTATTATSATTTAPGDFVALGLGGVTLTCPHYVAVSDPADFGILNSAGDGVAGSSATATLTLSKSAVESSPRPLIFWQVCYASPTPFPAIPGTSGTTVIGGTTYHTGLLLPCILLPPGHQQPCLISQRYTATGGVQLTFVALGDPFYRG